MVMLVGHGEWYADSPPWAAVPQGSSITFYTENLASLTTPNMAEIVSVSQLFRDAEPAQTVAEYMHAPNYTLKKLEDYIRQYVEQLAQVSGEDLVLVGVGGRPDRMQLCTDVDGTLCEAGIHRCQGVFALPEVQGQPIHWVACRAVHVQPVEKDINQLWLGSGADAEQRGAEDFLDRIQGLDVRQQVDLWLSFPAEERSQWLYHQNVRLWAGDVLDAADNNGITQEEQATLRYA